MVSDPNHPVTKEPAPLRCPKCKGPLVKDYRPKRRRPNYVCYACGLGMGGRGGGVS